MPKVTVLRNSVASGEHLETGKVYDLKESDANLLLRMGRVVPFSDPPPVVEDREKDLDVTKRAAPKKAATKKATTTKKAPTKKI